MLFSSATRFGMSLLKTTNWPLWRDDRRSGDAGGTQFAGRGGACQGCRAGQQVAYVDVRDARASGAAVAVANAVCKVVRVAQERHELAIGAIEGSIELPSPVPVPAAFELIRVVVPDVTSRT